MFGAKIEKDPQIERLRLDAFAKMAEIIEQECPKPVVPPPEEIRFVSFEDALKELVALKNS